MIKITPALPAQEWDRLETSGEIRFPIRGGARTGSLGDIAIWHRGTIEIAREDLPALIAFANTSLHPDDARRFTRELVDALETLSDKLKRGEPAAAEDLAALDRVTEVLAAYLSPP